MLVPLPLPAWPFSLLLPLFSSVSQPVSLVCVCLGRSFPLLNHTHLCPLDISRGQQASGGSGSTPKQNQEAKEVKT